MSTSSRLFEAIGQDGAMTEQAGPEAVGPAAFGRVDTDGTVYVRTSAGERTVGQVPDVPAAEALSFFTRRFETRNLRSRCWSGASRPGLCRPMMPLARSTRCAAQSPTRVLWVIWMACRPD